MMDGDDLLGADAHMEGMEPGQATGEGNWETANMTRRRKSHPTFHHYRVADTTA